MMLSRTSIRYVCVLKLLLSDKKCPNCASRKKCNEHFTDFIRSYVLLLQDVSKINEGKQPLYQDDTNKRIQNSLDLLEGLDEDAFNANRLNHPQAPMIEQE